MNELDPVVTVCHWDAEVGPPDARRRSPRAARGRPGPNYPSELVVSPDGRFAWAANRGHNSIAVLTIDGAATGWSCWTPWPAAATGPAT